MFKFFRKKEKPPEPPKSEEEKRKDDNTQMGMNYLEKKQPFIAKKFFKKAGLSGEEIYSKLVEAGESQITKDPDFTARCFMAVGYSEEELKPLFELAEFLKKQKEEQKTEEEPEKREPAPQQKLRLKEMGLIFVAKNQKDAARYCFEWAKLDKKEIDSLLELNLVGIDREKERIEKELARVQKEQ